MIWKWLTEKRNGQHYLAGYKLVSEKGKGDGILLRNKPPDIDTYFSPEGTLKWQIISNAEWNKELPLSEENPAYTIVDQPIPLTMTEKEERERRGRHKQINVELVAAALIAYSEGDSSGIERLKELLR